MALWKTVDLDTSELSSDSAWDGLTLDVVPEPWQWVELSASAYTSVAPWDRVQLAVNPAPWQSVELDLSNPVSVDTWDSLLLNVPDGGDTPPPPPYDINVELPQPNFWLGCGGRFQPGAVASSRAGMRYQAGRAVTQALSARHQQGRRATSASGARYQPGAGVSRITMAHHQHAAYAAGISHARHQTGHPVGYLVSAAHQPGQSVSRRWQSGHQPGAALGLKVVGRQRAGNGYWLTIGARHQPAISMQRVGSRRYQAGLYTVMEPQPKSARIVLNGGPWDTAALDLLCASGAEPLILYVPPASGPCAKPARTIIPPRRYYLMLNSASVVRTSDGAPIEASAVSLGIDADAWAWSGTLSLRRRSDLELLFGPTGSSAVTVTLNGYSWVLEAERWRERRRFGSESYAVAVRSRAIDLAAPRAALTSGVQVAERTAQQLATEALGSTGWTLDWSLTDWLVPGGVHSWHDAAPIERVLAVAVAAGGIVQSHPSGLSLGIAPRYPVLPWDWALAQPDVSLPLDIIEELGRDITPGAAYNGVFVAGRDQGVLAQVRRSGTQGDNLAPQVIDPLITHADAGRQRGQTILAASHIHSTITLSLPLGAAPLPELVQVGQLLEVSDVDATWRGQAAGISVSAERSPGGELVVRQHVEVERG